MRVYQAKAITILMCAILPALQSNLVGIYLAIKLIRGVPLCKIFKLVHRRQNECLTLILEPESYTKG